MHRTQWTTQNVYLHLICLITLLLMTFSVVAAAKSLVLLAYPEPAMGYEIRPMMATEQETQSPDAKECARQQQAQREWSKHNVMMNLVRDVAMLIVAGPIYIYHRRKIVKMAAGQAVAV